MAAFSSRTYPVIRYFFILGGIIYALDLFRWKDEIMLVFTGPVIYLAFWIRNLLVPHIAIPVTPEFNDYFLMLPATMIYFTGAGFLFKQLLGERGIIRHITIVAFAAFLAYLHFSAWRHLSAYFLAPEILS